MIKELMPSFPNYTTEMLEGNAPCGKGHALVSGGYADRWECKWGSAETKGEEILNADFSLNAKVTVYIIGDILYILDLRRTGRTDIWEYSNSNYKYPKGLISESHRHQLEPERIEKILNTEIDCKLWRMVQKRARELYQ